jgi:hypothetical protein
MADRITHSLGDRRGGGRSAAARSAALLALVLALGACSPIESWRSLTGVNRNDPNPATTPNSKNLAAGAALPYPNLATVPPPPTQALTEAQLKGLTQSLVADRANASYTDQKLRAALAEAGPPPPAPAPAAASGPVPAAVTLPASRSVAALPPAGTPLPALPPPVAAARSASPGSVAAAAPPADAAPATAGEAAAGIPKGMASGLRKPGEPPAPGPLESSLVAPQIPETPQPEQPVPAPPPPRIVALPKTGGGSVHLPPPPAPVPLPAAIGATAFQPPPPPPPPVLAPPAPGPTVLAAPGGKPPAPLAIPVADIAFPTDSAGLSDADRAALDKVAARYRQNPGRLRVVGYVGVGGSAADPLAAFRSALDHAQAVAAALAKTGIPAAKIAVEAAPAKRGESADHAEVLLEH